MTIFVQVNTRSKTPIWEQIVNQIKELVLKEMLRSGDKIPSVRELASILLVNPNTVSKAYQELERQGIIETFRGRGTFVCKQLMGTVDSKKREEFRNTLKQMIIEGSYLGLTTEDLINLVNEIEEELGGKIHDRGKSAQKSNE